METDARLTRKGRFSTVDGAQFTMFKALRRGRIAAAVLSREHHVGQLYALLFVDVCDSSRIMRTDEDAALQSISSEIGSIRKLVIQNDGHIRSFRGDGLFATFNSTHGAVRCALAIQARNCIADEKARIKVRTGVHIGEAFEVDGQLLGDSVNVAARIEAQAQPGSVLVSRPVYEALRGHADLEFLSVGMPYLKNIGDDLELFQVGEVVRTEKKQKWELRVIGSFALISPDGTEVVISEEGKALLAALVLAPEGKCNLSWFQEIIWDFLPDGERAECLKHLFSELQLVFGAALGDILEIDDVWVSIKLEALISDIAKDVERGQSQSGLFPVLFEDCGIKSEAFKEWILRQQTQLRSFVSKKGTTTRAHQPSITAPNLIEVASPLPTVFSIALLPPATNGDDAKARLIADLLADWLTRSLVEFDAIEIQDYRDGSSQNLVGWGTSITGGPDLMIQCRAASVDEMAQIAITALRPEDRKLIWSQSVVADQSEFLGLAGDSVASFVSYATDALLSALASGRHMRDPAAHHGAKKAIAAVHQLLTMTGPGLDRVEADILAAYNADQKPAYLAWLAYMATFRVGERYGVRDAALEEKAREMGRKALEADQHNALVLGLVAHVHSYVLREFSFADDLISRALETNPLSTMCWDSASLLYAYTGRSDKAMQAAQTARRLGRHSPYRHLFDGACCVAAAANGRFAEAVNFGECVIAVQPQFKSVLRYLAASYGHLGESERAIEIMEKLMQLEPDLSVERLRDHSYPVPSRKSAKLIETGLSRVGLKNHP